MNRILLPVALVMTLGGPLNGCSKPEGKVVIIHEGDEDAKPTTPPEPSEEEAYAARIKARDNAPEPTLDPEDPREQFKLVWGKGDKVLRSVQHERFDIFQQMRDLKLEDKGEKAEVNALVDRMSEWTAGHEAPEMETAATRLCTLIEEVRPRAEALMDNATNELTKLQAVTDELDAKQKAGGTVFQRQWDKLDKERARWSGPLQAGRFVFLAIKSMLDEAYVLADYGPRRAQLALKKCLGKVAEKELPLDLAQDLLQKVIGRSKWYRDNM